MTQQQFDKIIKERSRKSATEVFRFFWVSFATQMIVYAMLCHVVVKYWGEPAMIVSVIGIAIYIPFTIVFMRKYKKMAITPGSISAVISRRVELLESFYLFKKKYEIFLIPAATLIGTYLSFEFWVPGSVYAYPGAAVITFMISLGACIIAINLENKKSFDIPLSKLRMIQEDLNS